MSKKNLKKSKSKKGVVLNKSATALTQGGGGKWVETSAVYRPNSCSSS